MKSYHKGCKMDPMGTNEQDDTDYILAMAAAIDAMRWVGEMEAKGFAKGYLDGKDGFVLVEFSAGLPSRMMALIGEGGDLCLAFPGAEGSEWIDRMNWSDFSSDWTEGWISLVIDMSAVDLPDIVMVWESSSAVAKKLMSVDSIKVGRYRLGVGSPQIIGNPCLVRRR